MAVLPQWHVKDPCHSAKSAGGRLHLNMHTPLTQRSWSGLTMLLSRHSVGTYPENKLTHNLPENTRPQSFKLTEPLCTDHGLKSGISVCRLISTSKNKKCRWGMNGWIFSPNPCKWGKSHNNHHINAHLITVLMTFYPSLKSDLWMRHFVNHIVNN